MLLSKSLKGQSVDDLLDAIRSISFRKRIRINEFFLDFDKLRSGFVSISQFRRCLSMFGMDMNDTEFERLIAAYVDSNKRVNYVAFSEEIDKGMSSQ